MDILGTTSVSPIYGLTEVVLFLPIFYRMSRIGNFGRIVRISAEELRQLICKIRKKFKVLIFADKWVDWIGLAIMILN